MKPLRIDELRISKLASECDRLDEAKAPKSERMAAYGRLAAACNSAVSNARRHELNGASVR